MTKRMNGLDLRRIVLDNMRGKVTNTQLYHALRIKFPQNVKLLGSSIKVEKSKKKNALTSIVYMAPQKESVRYGGHNMCIFASIGCTDACLGKWSGRLRMRNSYNSKAWKTLTWLYACDVYKKLLLSEIASHEKKALRNNMIASVRLNGTTDIVFERKFPQLFESFPNVTFYDYTKLSSRFRYNLPNNYSLTFSRSESNQKECCEVLNNGGNVAVVFQNLNKAIETGYIGYKVFNGDLTDFRPSDPKNCIIGLSVKGRVKDSSGFVIPNGV